METKEIIKKIKQSKKYKYLSEEIIRGQIRRYIKSNQLSEYQITKSDIKEIKKHLHKLYSSYQTKKKKKTEKYFNPLNTKELLSLTISTKERLKDYQEIYKKIFSITDKPKIIIDLGAGLNIFSYPFMSLENLTYHSYDISEEDTELINKYIKIMKEKGLKGSAKILDIRDNKQIKKLSRSDVVFLFKIIDIIDNKNHKPSERLITYLLKNKTKYIVVSFPTKTITRKQMNKPDRKWFELMLRRNNLNFEKFNTSNEVFYIVKET